MNRKRIYVMSLLCVCFLLTAVTSNAETPDFHSHLLPRHTFKNRVFDKNPNSARLKAARAEAFAESKGVVTPEALAATSSAFTAKYTLYVACTNTPAGKTFPTIQGAVAVAQPYTLIKVCPGTYSNDGPGTGITVATSYVKIQGALKTEGSQTLSCGNAADPGDESYGFELLGSHDTVQYMTITNCDFGIETGMETEVRSNAIWNSWFSGNYTSIETYIGYATEVENNRIANSMYPIMSYGGIVESITGNTILGDGTYNEDGILSTFSVGDKIESNTVTGVAFGLDYGAGGIAAGGNPDVGYNTYSLVEGNHFNYNEAGIAIVDNNSGNTFQKNYTNYNAVGIASDNTSGADAIPNSGPNKFLSNQSFGNVDVDYIDGTASYTGTNSGTNDTTADYYKGNKGNNAEPSAIL